MLEVSTSEDIRWRAIALHCYLCMSSEQVAALLGVSSSSVRAWAALFEKTGAVIRKERVDFGAGRWPKEVEDHVRKFAAAHPCFFLEELKEELQREFPNLSNISTPTICRALHYDLNLTRKYLTTQAREARKTEATDYLYRLRPPISIQSSRY
ncbi:hypothetical protein BGZ83_010890 [Gryganskiella cystojenkinii]|nr:hypothetical protein BGZ83_010890 [Gryganskiella cystojenkinii]